jgi:hypothetical protein
MAVPFSKSTVADIHGNCDKPVPLADCRRFCSCQSLNQPQSSTTFNERRATGSISINYEQQNSTAFNRG